MNGKAAKAGLDIKEGDIIEIRFGNNTTKVQVLKTSENVRKDDAAGMYKSIE